MMLCDIGNTSLHFLDTATDEDFKYRVSEFNPDSIKDEVYYICVEPNLKERLKKLDNWIDISKDIDMKKYYSTMGIDRVVACEGAEYEDCVIIDAGSAITVDVIKGGIFQGGFIYPGIRAMGDAYKNISSALSYEFNFDLDLDRLPKNSQDAISYGFIKTLQSVVLSYNSVIVLTGGDAKLLSRVFKEAKVDERLLFKSMKRLLSL